mgnify:CR=1 FL=1
MSRTYKYCPNKQATIYDIVLLFLFIAICQNILIKKRQRICIIIGVLLNGAKVYSHAWPLVILVPKFYARRQSWNEQFVNPEILDQWTAMNLLVWDKLMAKHSAKTLEQTHPVKVL